MVKATFARAAAQDVSYQSADTVDLAYPVSERCLVVVGLYRQLCELLLQRGALPLKMQQPATQPLQQAPHSAMIDHWVVVHLQAVKGCGPTTMSVASSSFLSLLRIFNDTHGYGLVVYECFDVMLATGSGLS